MLWQKSIRAIPTQLTEKKIADLAFSTYGDLNTSIHGYRNCRQKVLKNSEEEIEKAPSDLRNKTELCSSET